MKIIDLMKRKKIIKDIIFPYIIAEAGVNHEGVWILPKGSLKKQRKVVPCNKISNI